MGTLKVVIFGTRYIRVPDHLIHEAVNLAIENFLYSVSVWDYPDIEIIEGGATGIDAQGKEYAIENNIPFKTFDADWAQYGKKAGHIRNRQMAVYADIGVGFIANMSVGSMNMVETMAELNKPVIVHHLSRDQYTTEDSLF